MKKQTTLVTLLTSIMIALAIVITTPAQAGQYSRSNLRLEVTNGMAVLTTLDDDWTYQLTPSLVVKPGSSNNGISDNGEVYLIYGVKGMPTGALYIYSHDLQNKSSEPKLYLSSVASLAKDANGAVIGYYTPDDTKNAKPLPTEAELRTFFGVTPIATETPTTQTPATETKTTEVKTTEVKSSEAPKASETPATQTPSTQTPCTQTPATQVPTTETPATEVKSSEAPKASETPTTETPSSEKKVTYASYVITNGSVKTLYNSDGKRVDRTRLSNKGKLTYHKVKFAKIKATEFSQKGNVLYITKKGMLVCVNQKTLSRSIIKDSGVKKFNVGKNGKATYAVMKNKTRISLKNY